jgi:penicillin-insensitive murein endopeptidase
MARCVPLLLLAACVLAGACTPPPGTEATVSYGGSNGGWLFRGVPLARRGEGYVLARPTDTTRYATPRLVAAIERAARAVAEAHPGPPPLRVGDLSAPLGGKHGRHGSHRTGRDADLIYYTTDLEGRPVIGSGFLAFDRFGLAVAPEGSPPPLVTGATYRLDEARTWTLVKSLVLDEAGVQWIFCGAGIKSRLLRYAARHERNAEAIVRASWVLHQPTTGNPHVDHMHVRVVCGVDQRALGCIDRDPEWPWLREAFERPPQAAERADDATVVGWLLDDEPS